jgi:hypothetical protein
MAEFNFYGTAGDWDILIEVVFSHPELSVIPDVFYATPRATCYRRDSKAFRQAFEVKRGLFIKGPFTSKGEVLRSVGRLGYCVDVVTLGPMIDLSLPHNERFHGGLLLRPGWLSHQSEYWSADRSASFQPSPELKVAYASLKKEFKQCLVQTEISGRTWIGKQALHQLRTGKALILHRGKWWRFHNEVPKLDPRKHL